MDLWMMETICQEPQLSTPVMMDSGWWDPARDSVRRAEAGLERHLPANVKSTIVYEGNCMCYETYHTEIRCPALKDPLYGSVDDGDNLPGTTAKYTCNDGFRLVGSSKRLCQKDGSWAGEAPTCKRMNSCNQRYINLLASFPITSHAVCSLSFRYHLS